MNNDTTQIIQDVMRALANNLNCCQDTPKVKRLVIDAELTYRSNAPERRLKITTHYEPYTEYTAF